MSYNLNEVQPVDGYVMSLLKTAREKFGVDVDLGNPTREQRLEAALKFDGLGYHGGKWSAMEVMVGRRVDSSEPLAETLGFLEIARIMFPNDDVREHYKGLAHVYWPKKEISE